MSLNIHGRSEQPLQESDAPPPYEPVSPRFRHLNPLKYFYVRTSAPLTGACEYALAIAQPPMGNDTMSLVFNVSREPFAEMGRCLTRPITHDKKADLKQRDIITLPVEGDDIQRITKILVNIHFPFSFKENLSTVGVAQYCKLTFPNLNPRECALILHHGDETYRYDKALN